MARDRRQIEEDDETNEQKKRNIFMLFTMTSEFECVSAWKWYNKCL